MMFWNVHLWLQEVLDLCISLEASYLITHPFTSKSILLPQIPVFHAQKALTAQKHENTFLHLHKDLLLFCHK